MKNEEKLIWNIFFTMVLICCWAGVLFVTFLLYLMSDMFRLLGNGLLVFITAFLYVLAFILPIIFRKRITKYISLPLSFFIFTVCSVGMVGCMLFGAHNYISDFSREKWDDNARLRIYMIDDLNKKHPIIGKTEKEIMELLGEPTYILDVPRVKYDYYVGESMIDPLGYQIEFENHVAVHTQLVEH